MVLGVLSLIAAVVFAFRAATIEATAERIWSAILFGGMGIVMVGAYMSTRHDSTN
jgi:hypothetical protein